MQSFNCALPEEMSVSHLKDKKAVIYIYIYSPSPKSPKYSHAMTHTWSPKSRQYSPRAPTLSGRGPCAGRLSTSPPRSSRAKGTTRRSTGGPWVSHGRRRRRGCDALALTGGNRTLRRVLLCLGVKESSCICRYFFLG